MPRSAQNNSRGDTSTRGARVRAARRRRDRL